MAEVLGLLYEMLTNWMDSGFPPAVKLRRQGGGLLGRIASLEEGRQGARSYFDVNSHDPVSGSGWDYAFTLTSSKVYCILLTQETG